MNGMDLERVSGVAGIVIRYPYKYVSVPGPVCTSAEPATRMSTGELKGPLPATLLDAVSYSSDGVREQKVQLLEERPSSG